MRMACTVAACSAYRLHSICHFSSEHSSGRASSLGGGASGAAAGGASSGGAGCTGCGCGRGLFVGRLGGAFVAGVVRGGGTTGVAVAGSAGSCGGDTPARDTQRRSEAVRCVHAECWSRALRAVHRCSPLKPMVSIVPALEPRSLGFTGHAIRPRPYARLQVCL